MKNRQNRINQELFHLFAVGHSAVDSPNLVRSLRLDSSFFLDNSDSEIQKRQRLGDIAKVFTVYIQSPKLAYVKQADYSLPYLSPSEAFEFHLEFDRWVSVEADPRLIDWKVKKDWILLTRSGTVGQVTWVDAFLDGSLIPDAIRIVIEEQLDRNFIYAFLRSPSTFSKLGSAVYGSVVGHISVDQLKEVRFPSIEDNRKFQISGQIEKSKLAFARARVFLEDADRLVGEVNGLPEVNANHDKDLHVAREVEAFTVPSSDVGSQAARLGYRLDEHFHNPTARQVVSLINASRSRVSRLGAVCSVLGILPRFKRNYVNPDYGIPFLSGKNIIQTRPVDIKFLASDQFEEILDLKLNSGWTLVTRSGTLGRTCFVWKNFEGYAASEHILRVIPHEAEVDPGYLYAFLSSRFGYEQVLRFRYGSVIDEISDWQLREVLIAIPSMREQKRVGDLVRNAYEARAEANRLEDEAQAMLVEALQMPV